MVEVQSTLKIYLSDIDGIFWECLLSRLIRPNSRPFLFSLFLICSSDTTMSDDLQLHAELISRRGLNFEVCSDEREGNLQPSTIFFVGSPIHVMMHVFAGYATIDKVWTMYRQRLNSVAWASVDLASRRQWMKPQPIWRIQQWIPVGNRVKMLSCAWITKLAMRGGCEWGLCDIPVSYPHVR